MTNDRHLAWYFVSNKLLYSTRHCKNRKRNKKRLRKRHTRFTLVLFARLFVEAVISWLPTLFDRAPRRVRSSTSIYYEGGWNGRRQTGRDRVSDWTRRPFSSESFGILSGGAALVHGSGRVLFRPSRSFFVSLKVLAGVDTIIGKFIHKPGKVNIVFFVLSSSDPFWDNRGALVIITHGLLWGIC